MLCSLGAALAHLYTAALLVPDHSPWNTKKVDLDRFKALCTQGQPRLGTFEYNRRLEYHLCKGPDPSKHRYVFSGELGLPVIHTQQNEGCSSFDGRACCVSSVQLQASGMRRPPCLGASLQVWLYIGEREGGGKTLHHVQPPRADEVPGLPRGQCCSAHQDIP